jgi:hypothetical protein
LQSDDHIKNIIDDIAWTPHGHKHFPPKSKKIKWRDIVKSTKTKPAKYSREVDIEALERFVYEHGQDVTSDKTWKVMEFDKVIGAKNGKESRWVRVEISANTIHGHPITKQEFDNLTK